MQKKLIILKLGGSAITYKKENLKEVNEANLERISSEIAEAKDQQNFSLIIIHGVGPFGHVIAKEFDLAGGYKNNAQIEAISRLHKDLLALNGEVIKFLINKGINAMPFQPSAGWHLDDGRIIAGNLEIIKKLIGLEIIPVFHGDLLIDSQKGFGVLSGDRMAYYLAKNLKADRAIMGTDIDGVFDSDPNIDKNAKLFKELSKKTMENLQIGESTAIDVTGGMKGKVGELLELADLEIESQIINITKADVLKRVLLGEENIGTRIIK